MASNPEFVQYVADQLSGAGTITYKKMFGEYGVYCCGKIFAVVCDNQLFIKITEAGRAFSPGLTEAPPYKGAKNYFFIEDIDDRDFLTALTIVTCQALLEPQKKKRRNENGL